MHYSVSTSPACCTVTSDLLPSSKALEILHDHEARGVSAELMYARSVEEAEAFLFSED